MESEALRRKIEETIIDILKTADLETITEYNVRTIAAEQLGIDFSDLDRKWLVRRVVEAFLLSSPTEDKVEEETKEVVEEQPQTIPNVDPKEARDDGGRLICKIEGALLRVCSQRTDRLYTPYAKSDAALRKKLVGFAILSDKRSVSILKFGENNLVSIRDCYQKDGNQLHSDKGITLTARQWSAFRDNVPAIQEAITKMESRIRSNIEAATPSSAAHVPQEPETSNPIINGQENTPFPIEPRRLNGRNYYSWAPHMASFLTQLKIGYVLTDPCPHAPQEARKWADDDYMCRRNILNYLSDHLFHLYSKKLYSTAKELWEELRLVYNEDFGAKRSHVHNYIHFQMVDGISILEQVQIFNNMADSVIASGMWFDENFHVSAIVSKLPHSWRDFRAKLMREELLPFDKLMHNLRLEEAFRNRSKKEGALSQGRFRKFDFRGQVNGRQKGIVDGTLK